MARTPSTMRALGSAAPDFDLTEPLTGRRVRLADFSGQPLLLLFTCNHCPFVLHILDELVRVLNRYQAKGLAVLAINANDAARYPDDAPDKMAQMAQHKGFAFPYLHDESQAVAQAYQAACTPDFFLYDAAHRLVYRGQFDDARPGNGVPVTGQDLRAAIEAVLTGRAPVVEQRPSLGCNIKWKPGHELL
ncbi:MAG: thioredoxin family protein [Serpentinimonas sp.]|nr:thioredoxin family protein [Serpentinimonas sp.]